MNKAMRRMVARVEALTGRVRNLERVVEAVAAGLSPPPGRRAGVRPTVVFFAPQPEGTDLEALTATARRIVESTGGGGGT